jgi:hypothetical protein
MTVPYTFGTATSPIPLSNLDANFTALGSSSNITYNSSVPRTVSSKLSDMISVKDFGAIGDGATDDTAAIQSALTYCVNQSVSLYIPTGTYILSSPISASGASKAISIFGDGASNTRLVWTSTGGITLDYSGASQIQNIASPVYMNFGMYSRNLSIGTAFTYISTTSGSGTTNGPTFMNLYIDADFIGGTSANSWTNGIKLISANNANIVNCSLEGLRVANPYVGNGIWVAEDCTEGPNITDCQLGSWNKGVCFSISTATHGTEGGRILSSSLVANDYGFYADFSAAAAGSPGLQIANSHISSRVTNIYINNLNQIIITGILFYVRSDATVTNFYDVYCKNVLGVTLTNNNNARSTKYGVTNDYSYYLDNVDYAIFDGNVIQGTACDVGVYINSNCSNITIGPSNDFGAATKDVTNLIATNIAAYRIWGANTPGFAIVNFVTQSIPNNTISAISLNGAVSKTCPQTVTSVTYPTRLIVPMGVNRVIAYAEFSFDNNTTGYRRADIYQNGVVVSTAVMSPAGITTFDFMTLSTQVLSVNANDYFELFVEQTSGGSLNALGGTRSYLQLQFVN